ncbi:hypothetical protein PR048_018186 [Dryococelus australis]|uniref:Uncharacterized protein n=1 Tax=Dryococelus australis TaxID=614101 RepID=A0ABQ9HBM5_9NEOP|nr:hypothetical protein PR048_018186 [Dryococelus australis]
MQTTLHASLEETRSGQITHGAAAVKPVRSFIIILINWGGKFLLPKKKIVPGQEWVKSFLKRHHQLSVCFAANIKKKQSSCRREFSDRINFQSYRNFGGC